MGNQLGDAGNRLRAAGILADLAVHQGAQCHFPDWWRGGCVKDDGAERGERVERLTPDPLWLTPLKIASGDIVGDGVTADVVERILDRNVPGALPDYDGKLAFVVKFGGYCWENYRLAVGDQAGRELGKKDDPPRACDPALGDMVGVVEP